MKYVLVEKTVAFSSAYTNYTTAIDVGSAGLDSISCMAIVDVDTPAAVVVPSADINFTTDIFTKTAHGLTTGVKGQFTTSGALPTGISAATDYFIIYLTANTFQVATSLALAQAGTAVNMSDAGTGDQTFTPTALAGGTIKFQQSNDNSTWVDLGSATNITVDANLYIEKDRPTSKYVRVGITLTAGHISASLQLLGKGDKA